MKKEENAVPMDEEQVEELNPINSEEALTLVRDVYSIRGLFIGLYNNRKAIGKRINLISLTISILYTFYYVAMVIFGGITNDLKLGYEIAIYCLLGAYVLGCVALIVATVKAPANKSKRQGKILKIIRLFAKFLSIAMAIVAIILYKKDTNVFQIVSFGVSIGVLVLQALPLIFGGVIAFVKWLLSPERKNVPFMDVLTEWYDVVISEKKTSKLKSEVDKKYHKQIKECISKYFVGIGEMRITKIKSEHIQTFLEGVDAKDKNVVEGVLNSVFYYAQASSYVSINPCVELELEGDVSKKNRPSIIKKIGKGLFGAVIDKLGGKKD